MTMIPQGVEAQCNLAVSILALAATGLLINRLIGLVPYRSCFFGPICVIRSSNFSRKFAQAHCRGLDRQVFPYPVASVIEGHFGASARSSTSASNSC